ncbi:MAG: prolyl oligopeptidase family serine peptidase [Crocinitomicaceae bacterium]|nr:prolyl oligopeptidase family serine peptidase [Crocinitomicaceae bacterium]
MKKIEVVQFIIFCILLSATAVGQKKIIDYQAFDSWKTLKNEQTSISGKYVTYEIQPLKGDTYLYWYSTETKQLDSVLRAKNAQFSQSENYLIYTIEAGYDTLRNAELAKVDKKKLPKDSLAVLSLETGKVVKIADIKKFEISNQHNWLAYTENENKLKEEEGTKTVLDKKKKKVSKKESKNTAKEEVKLPKSEGKVLRLQNLETNEKYAFKDVTDFKVAKKGEAIAFVQNQNDTNTLKVLNLTTKDEFKIDQKFLSIEGITFDKHAGKLAFLGSGDTTKTKVYALYSFNLTTKTLSKLVDTTSQFIQAGLTASHHATPIFSEIKNRLYFGVYDTPQYEKKDTLTESEKPKLDIWTYNEPILHTQQLKNLENDLKKTYWYWYDYDSQQIIALENDTLQLQSDFDELSTFSMATNSQPYELNSMWDISSRKDYYKVNLESGIPELIKKGVTYAADLSRRGDKFVYYDEQKGNYLAMDLNENTTSCLTCEIKNRTWTTDKNGMPMVDEPYGVYGWNKEGTQLYIGEKNDFFVYDFSKNELINLTQNIGAKNNIEFKAREWNSDSSFVELNNFYLIGLDKTTKGSHFYTFNDGRLTRQAYWDAKITSVKRSRENATYILRKMTVQDYPELNYWKDTITAMKQISITNPQQSDYNWATVELVSWKSYKGIDLEGLIYKPEDFDSTKKYPLLVYYYEMYSDGLHTHYTPRPTASIIFPTEYASGGYIVFIPDIRYQAGYPARSAYDCIMSGTDFVLKKYPQIDAERMGLQGQSWGGYQTAQLVTMTNRFKAAMAGAPVGNMFSAYGGIRWGTGMSRQFQYEQTQSRIGKTIWEAPELYIENSPVFHLPKVTTPLLIMHNDNDGAVPWYQGIELFTGLRRLGKPSWLLNYNGDNHNLMKNQNRRDLSIRMRQFFDHYLLNQPAPRWMIEGIPAVKKDKELRYEIGQD